MAFNSYDLANTSLVKTGSLTEMYIPLFYDSASCTATSSTTSVFIQKGSESCSSSVTSAAKLHTLNTSWSPNQKFALEASFSSSGSGSTYQVYFQLYDITANTSVSGTQITSTSSSYTVFRSGQFTLVPGHTYGIVLWTLNSNCNARLSKASLIALLS